MENNVVLALNKPTGSLILNLIDLNNDMIDCLQLAPPPSRCILSVVVDIHVKYSAGFCYYSCYNNVIFCK